MDIKTIFVESITRNAICLLDEELYSLTLVNREGLGIALCITCEKKQFEAPTIIFSSGSMRKEVKPEAQLNISHIGKTITNYYSLPFLGFYMISYRKDTVEFKLERK